MEKVRKFTCLECKLNHLKKKLAKFFSKIFTPKEMKKESKNIWLSFASKILFDIYDLLSKHFES